MRIPKKITVLPNDEPGVFATVNGKRITEPTKATDEDQIGIEFERNSFGINMGSINDPLKFSGLR